MHATIQQKSFEYNVYYLSINWNVATQTHESLRDKAHALSGGFN